MVTSVREKDKRKSVDIAQPSGPPRAHAEAGLCLTQVFGARSSHATRSPILLSTNAGTKITCMA